MTGGRYFIAGLFIIISCTPNKNKFETKNNEPVFANLDSDEIELKKTVDKAQSQISLFVQKLKSKPETSSACVKIYIPDNKGKGAYIWLAHPVFDTDTCVAMIFEIPAEFTHLKPGDKLKFKKDRIQDWYILDKEGKMEGGYSLRYIRQKLSTTKEQEDFDKYIGVKVYQ